VNNNNNYIVALLLIGDLTHGGVYITICDEKITPRKLRSRMRHGERIPTLMQAYKASNYKAAYQIVARKLSRQQALILKNLLIMEARAQGRSLNDRISGGKIKAGIMALNESDQKMIHESLQNVLERPQYPIDFFAR
jgi:hypothetical protein